MSDHDLGAVEPRINSVPDRTGSSAYGIKLALDRTTLAWIRTTLSMASFGFVPGAPLSRDQWLMLQRDNVAAAGSAGLDAFGIVPTPMGAVAPSWLGRFVKGGRFAPTAANDSATA